MRRGRTVSLIRPRLGRPSAGDDLPVAKTLPRRTGFAWIPPCQTAQRIFAPLCGSYQQLYCLLERLRNASKHARGKQVAGIVQGAQDPAVFLLANSGDPLGRLGGFSFTATNPPSAKA
jgi:hypothetical protein